MVPSAASSATQSIARASGGSGGGCDDHNPPSSNWGHGWWHDHGKRGPYWHGWGDGNGYFGGGSRDYGCDALHPGKVATVKVAVARMGDGTCRHLLGHGGHGSAVPCSCGVRHWPHRHRHTGSGGSDIKRRLPHGRYRLHRRAIDSSGNHEAPDIRTSGSR